MITYVYRFLRDDENGVEVECDRLTLGISLNSDEIELYCIHLDNKYNTMVGLDTFEIFRDPYPYSQLLEDTLTNIKMNGVL